MTTYFAPTITASGLSIPTYQDIVNQLVADAQSIFGSDIYLGADSQDYQWISAFASIIYDSFLTAQAVYNARGPGTAIGSGLDIIVGLNGLVRMPAVYSTCPVVLTGTAGTTITGGVVGDVNGNDWSLPSPVIIGPAGTITVTATCQTAGSITANAGAITTIVTPTLGWTSVTNAVAATVGTAAETDSALRARQAVSTAQPSQSVLNGLQGALLAISGVTSVTVYENDTSTTNSLGLPPNSVTCVVQGGTAAAIGQAILVHKSPGCATNGTSSVQVTDQFGVVNTFYYDVPTDEFLDVVVNLTPLPGWVASMAATIQGAIASYLNSMPSGTDVYMSGLWGAALSANPTPANPAFAVTSITAALHGGVQGTAPIPIAYNQVAQGNAAYVTVNS